jgi:hypothetical protein
MALLVAEGQPFGQHESLLPDNKNPALHAGFEPLIQVRRTGIEPELLGS